MQSSNPAGKPVSMTIVTCVESGILEPLTLRMVDSLRRFGGRFANVEVVAVTPRMTPPLATETVQRMSGLGVHHLRVRPKNSYAWHHYMNKVEAIAAVEAQATSEVIAWLDSDIIFLRAPDGLELPPGVDFIASAPDAGVIGSTGEADPNDAFWQRAAALVGKNAADLPWLETSDGRRVRFYWNSGVFAYRRSTGFGKEYLNDCKVFLDRRVARTHSQVHFMDQVMLGLTVVRLGMNWGALTDSSNFPVCSFLPRNYDPSKVEDVSVLHYHDSMNPDLWPKLLDTIGPSHPKIRAWLEPQGPVVIPGSTPAWLGREALRLTRGVYRRMYYSKSGFNRATLVETKKTRPA